MGLRHNDGDGIWQGRFSGKGLAQVAGYTGLRQCQRGRVEVLLMGGRGLARIPTGGSGRRGSVGENAGEETVGVRTAQRMQSVDREICER